MKNITKLKILVLLILLSKPLSANTLTSHFTDGPYLFWENDIPTAYYINDNSVSKEQLVPDENGKYFLDWSDGAAEQVEIIPEFPLYQTEYELPDKFLVISDLHGNLDGTLELLLAAGVIDPGYNWIYDGWLIVNGDIFDRGDEVTNILWLLYHLQQQADASNSGKLITVLGNHEMMTVGEDEHKVKGKYALSCELLHKNYNELYGRDTFLGKWLRSWQSILILEKFLFVHAGISPGLSKKFASPVEINLLISDFLNQNSYDESKLDYVLGRNGPFWYRGYFYRKEKWEAADPSKINKIRNVYDIEKIIVGHTTTARVKFIQNNQIIAVDAGLKYQDSGEALLYQKGSFFVLDSSGKISELSSQ